MIYLCQKCKNDSFVQEYQRPDRSKEPCQLCGYGDTITVPDTDLNRRVLLSTEVPSNRAQIQEEAERIRQDLIARNLTLYGEKLYMDDPDEVLVAAYLIGKVEGGQSILNQLKGDSDGD